MRGGEVIAAFLILVAGILFIGFLLSFPLMLLWNYCLVPAVPVVQEVGWLQMWGLSILFSLLFKSNFRASTKD
jgi:hypothetical protein